MPEINVGDRLKLEDGSEVVIETFWNQGKHRVFKLTDGRQLFDLHLNDKITKIEPEKPKINSEIYQDFNSIPSWKRKKNDE